MSIEDDIAQALVGTGLLQYPGDRHSLTAAVMPLVKRAQAEALRDAVRDFENEVGIEEFDSLSARPGRHGQVRWVGIEEAWENQGPFMDWLRNRADRIESEVPDV